MPLVKKLALGMTAAGMACIAGLGLAQPASANIIGFGNLTCEGWSLHEGCYLNVASSQEVWALNGTVVTAWNGMGSVTFSCGAAGSVWTIDVTYLDSSNVTQSNHLSGNCVNTPPQ